MNKKAVIGGVAAVAVVVIGFLAYKVMSLRAEAAKWAGPIKEIVEEEVKRDGTVTRSRYVSLIDAPADKVLKAIWDVENSPQTVENIKLAKLLESKGNTKLVEINLQALTLPLQNFTMEWTLYPEQNRVTFKTVKSQAQDIEGEYKLEPSPDGKRTRLTYATVSRDKIAVPFPQSILDSANRETYVNTVRGIQKTVKQG
jgi:ribosome-associated toxin RatA of RatAB toxin-antitoxin module